MKQTILLTIVLTVLVGLARPAAANPVEDTTCQGPQQIVFAGESFYSQGTDAYCTTQYTSSQKDGWPGHTIFTSQLITHPQNSVAETLRQVENTNLLSIPFHLGNASDIITSYIQSQNNTDPEILRFILLRALHQTDGSVRIYRLDFSVEAPKPTVANATINQAHEEALTFFVSTLKTHQKQWKKEIETLQIVH